jgi:hypothetical protein
MAASWIPAAVQAMRKYTRELEAAYKAGTAEYVQLDARDVLYALGYQRASADTVLEAIGEAGFNYCLDPTVPHDGKYPPRFACVWGVDQLRSRLDSIKL